MKDVHNELLVSINLDFDSRDNSDKISAEKQEIVMGRTEERWQMAPAVLLVIPYIIAAALRSDNFGDTYAYRRVFSEAPNRIAELPFYLQGIKKIKVFPFSWWFSKALLEIHLFVFF